MRALPVFSAGFLLILTHLTQISESRDVGEEQQRTRSLMNGQGVTAEKRLPYFGGRRITLDSRDTRKVAVEERLSSFRGGFCVGGPIQDIKPVVAEKRYPPFGGGRITLDSGLLTHVALERRLQSLGGGFGRGGITQDSGILTQVSGEKRGTPPKGGLGLDAGNIRRLTEVAAQKRLPPSRGRNTTLKSGLLTQVVVAKRQTPPKGGFGLDAGNVERLTQVATQKRVPPSRGGRITLHSGLLTHVAAGNLGQLTKAPGRRKTHIGMGSSKAVAVEKRDPANSGNRAGLGSGLMKRLVAQKKSPPNRGWSVKFPPRVEKRRSFNEGYLVPQRKSPVKAGMGGGGKRLVVDDRSSSPFRKGGLPLGGDDI